MEMRKRSQWFWPAGQRRQFAKRSQMVCRAVAPDARCRVGRAGEWRNEASGIGRRAGADNCKNEVKGPRMDAYVRQCETKPMGLAGFGGRVRSAGVGSCGGIAKRSQWVWRAVASRARCRGWVVPGNCETKPKCIEPAEDVVENRAVSFIWSPSPFQESWPEIVGRFLKIAVRTLSPASDLTIARSSLTT